MSDWYSSVSRIEVSYVTQILTSVISSLWKLFLYDLHESLDVPESQIPSRTCSLVPGVEVEAEQDSSLEYLAAPAGYVVSGHCA